MDRQMIEADEPGRICCDTVEGEPHECPNPSTNPALPEEDE